MQNLHVINRAVSGDFYIRRGSSIFTSRNNDACLMYDVFIYGPSRDGSGSLYKGKRYQIYKILKEESGELIREYSPVPDSVMTEAFKLCNQRRLAS
jgi:hypothetical protein